MVIASMAESFSRLCVDATVPACGFIPVSYPAGRPALFFRKLVQRIREEFEEAPDLRMTVGEAARFWALDVTTCERVLTELLRSGFLARGADERYRQVIV
jgi:hypothetical protein